MHVLTHTSNQMLITFHTTIGYWKMEKICTSRLFLEDAELSDNNILLTTHPGGSECSNHDHLWAEQRWKNPFVYI